MKYDHMVKVNGIYYATGQEAPENRLAEEKESLPFSYNGTEKKYTKTEINRMNTAELRKTAINAGVKNANEMTGTELKEYLISLFEL